MAMKTIHFFLGSNAQFSAEHFPCHLASRSLLLMSNYEWNFFHPSTIAHRVFIRFSLSGWVSWQNAISSFMSRPVRALRNFSRAVKFESSRSIPAFVSCPMWEKQHPQHIVRICSWELSASNDTNERKALESCLQIQGRFVFYCLFFHTRGIFFIYFFYFREKMWENRAELANENSINVK